MKKGILKGMGIGLALLAVAFAVIYFAPFGKTQEFIAADYKYDLAYFNELSDMPVLTQETGHTCYIVSLAIVKNYLGFEASEQELRTDLDLLNRDTGMLPNDYLIYANKVFEPLNMTVSPVNPASQAEILNVISDSLEKNLPVVIFYATKDDWNKPHYNTHYAVVYGLDMAGETVKISNPYGYSEELTFAELFDGLDFTSYEAEPFSFRLARKAGMVKSNTLFVFENIS